MNITMTGDDFDALFENAGEWRDVGPEQSDRFSHPHTHVNTAPSWDWEMAYWVGTDWLRVMFLRTFLADHGEDFDVLSDNYHDGPFPGGYVIVTNYRSPAWVPRSGGRWSVQQADRHLVR
jgi:hypothetical protein